VTRFGRPISSPRDTVVIVSGGASTAPSRNAAASPIDGRSHAEIRPSAPVVNTTSMTPRLMIGRRFAPNPDTLAPRAPE